MSADIQSSENQEQSRLRRVFGEEFKRDAVQLIVEKKHTSKRQPRHLAWANRTCVSGIVSWPPEPCGENAILEELQAENKRL